MDKVDNSTPKQLGGATGKGFMPGKSGNPAGRPPGSLSVMGKLKQMWADDPEDFEEFVKEIRADKALRRELIQQIDGKPKESVEITGKDGGALQFQMISFDDYDSIQPKTEQTD